MEMSTYTTQRSRGLSPESGAVGPMLPFRKGSQGIATTASGELMPVLVVPLQDASEDRVDATGRGVPRVKRCV